MDDELQVLLVEDNALDARLVVELFRDGPERVRVRTAARLREGLELARVERFDLLLLDLALPDSRGTETVRKAQAAVPELPLVVLTGHDDHDLALEAVSLGAQDYLCKTELTPSLLVRTTRYAIERAKTRRQLAFLAESLHRKNEDLKTFSHAAAHDLRAPLRRIRQFVHLVLEGAQEDGGRLSEKGLAYLGRVEDQAESLSSLLENLLEYARAGNTEATFEELAVEALIEEAAGVLGLPDGFEVRVSCEVPLMRVARAPFELTLRNLVENAVKHHDRTTGTVWIDVRDRGTVVELAVSDDGPGIAARDQERIFGAFERGGASGNVAGSGLGLALVRSVVERSGGLVVVSPRPGRGTVFTVSWPKCSSPTFEPLANA